MPTRVGWNRKSAGNPEGASLKNEGPIVLLFQQLPWNGGLNHSHVFLTVPEAESLISGASGIGSLERPLLLSMSSQCGEESEETFWCLLLQALIPFIKNSTLMT